jgi:hypothetical protein
MRWALLATSLVTASCAVPHAAEHGGRTAARAVRAEEGFAARPPRLHRLGLAGVSLTRHPVPGYGLSMLAPTAFAGLPARSADVSAGVFTSESPGILPAVSVVALVAEAPGLDLSAWDLRDLCEAYLEMLRSSASARYTDLAFADGAVAGVRAETMQGKVFLRSREYAVHAVMLVRLRGDRHQLVFVEVAVDTALEAAGAEAARVALSLAESPAPDGAVTGAPL